MNGSKASFQTFPQLRKNIRFVNLVVKCLLEFKHAIRRLGINFQSGSRTFRINYDIFCIQKVWMVLQSLRDFGMVMIQDILKILQENLDIARCFYYPVIWRWTEPSFPGGTFCYSWTSGGFQWLFWTGSQAVHLSSHLDWSAKNCMWIDWSLELEIARLSWTPHSWESESRAAAL